MGKVNGNDGGAWRLFLVGAFAALVAFAGLRSLPPLDRDEARFAQATAQMLESGDFLTIRFQEKERNKKPAGIYWLQAASVAALSDVDARKIWAYRVPSLIGVVLAAIFTFLAARRLYDADTAFLAGLLLSSAPLIAAEATIAKTDGVLLGMICLSQWAFIEIFSAWRENRPASISMALVFWIAQGVAILVKGPIAPFITGLTGLSLLIITRKAGWVFRLRPFLGILILAVMIIPWVLAIQHATDGRFLAEAVGGDMLGKIGDAQESHWGPPGYHLFLLWGLFWPAAALLGPGLIHLWRDRADWQAAFLLSWIAPAWIAFEISATKLPHYVMPLYPALAIVAAHAAIKDGAAQTVLRKWGAATYAVLGLLAAGLVAALPILLSAAAPNPAYFAIALVIAAAGLAISFIFWRGRALQGGMLASLFAAAYAWTAMALVLPTLSDLAISPRLSTALAIDARHPVHDAAMPVALAGYSEPSAVFLIGTDTVLTTGDNAARLFKSGAVGAVGVETRQQNAFEREMGPAALENARALAVIDGLNYSNGKKVSITIYVPADKAGS